MFGAYKRLSQADVIPLDVHAANIVIGRHSGRPYIVDFEMAHLGPAASSQRAKQFETEIARRFRV